MYDQSVPNGTVLNTAMGVTNRLPELLDFYISWQQGEGHSEATIRHVRTHLDMFVNWLVANGHAAMIDHLNPMVIMAFLNAPKKNGKSRAPRYKRTLYQNIDTWMNWAVELGLINDSPSKAIKPPKVPKTHKPFLTPEAVQKILDLCPLNTFLGARRYAMLMIFGTTGIRHKEMADLMLADVDLKTRMVRIRMGKGQKERSVPLLAPAIKPLLAYLRQRTDSRPELWLTEERTPLSYWGIDTDIERLMERAKVRGQVRDVCHIFRRTFAADSIRQNVPRQYIQVVGGWSKPVMIDKYAEAMLLEEKQALEAYQAFKPFSK